MRVEGKRYRDEWLPNYYPARAINDSRLRISRTGKTQVLTADEDLQLDEVFMDESLFLRLERTGHIITQTNSIRVLNELKKWHEKTFAGPELHIVVTTKRCNLNCIYCHMNPEPTYASKAKFDLQPDVASAIVRFAFESPNKSIKFEFQGGEPFLNFEGIVHTVEEAKRLSSTLDKVVRFTVVSNLMVAHEEHLKYCYDNGISISYSLNGPADVHDHFRRTRSGSGSFTTVMRRISEINERYPGMLSSSPLCVVSNYNAPYIEQMIDFFHDAGFKAITILKVKNLGNAVSNNVEFTIEDFLKYYLQGLDYIYEKNRSLREVYAERSLRVVLSKILSDSDVGFVDWRNPCGDVSGALTYDYDGEILPSDEARSLRTEFTIGNVTRTSYKELMHNRATFRTMNLSLRDRDPECRNCAFNPFCGVSPVLDFARTGNAAPLPHQSEECLFTLAVLDWVFSKLADDPLPLVRMIPGIDRHLPKLLRGVDADTRF